MNFLDELESLAINAASDVDGSAPPTSQESERWQRLFNLSPSAARDNIIQYRDDLFRPRLSDELWKDIREEKERLGYDREAYEYDIFCYGKRPLPSTTSTHKVAGRDVHTYAVLLSGLLDSAERIKQIADLSSVPRVSSVESETEIESTEICYINGDTKQRILDWLSSEGSDYKPVFMTFSIARKQLCSYSAYPTLGLDCTLPQNRGNGNAFRPGQDEFPCWYFFYGTLAEPDRLMRLLALPETPKLEEASVEGGSIRTWRGKYRALVDGAGDVEGHAFLVETQAQEEALRVYEGSMYEVVRCRLRIRGRTVAGLTFRFIDISLLDD